jgi:hypothetical protein
MRKDDNNNDRATRAGLSIGHDNARYRFDFPCYITYMNDATHISNTSEPASTSARVSGASIVLKGQTTMTTIFLATDSTDSTPICFSNIGTALEYVRDSHGDLNAEGAALMLETRSGLVPATNKAVKAARGTLRFVATGADAASVVAGLQSKLDGALSACALVGIDPANVAKVISLREDLTAAQGNVGAEDDSVSFEIAPRELHKRAHNKRA